MKLALQRVGHTTLEVIVESAVDRYEELESGYRPRDLGGATVHVHLATTDFQLRFVTMCAAAALREMDPDQVRLSRSPGFGAFLSFLKRASSLLRSSTQSDGDATAQLVDSVLAAVQARDGRDPDFGTLVKLRNHVFHGGPVPAGHHGDDLAQRVGATTEVVSDLIRGFLDGASVSTVSDGSGLDQVELRWSAKRLSLWPFVCSDETGSWCVFSTFSRLTPTYIRASQRDVRVEGYGERLVVALSAAMVPASEDRTFPDFVNELRADLDGFRDRDHQPHHDELDGEISMMWVRALSTGSEFRYDRFRLGEGEQRQWWSPESERWVSYPGFLRQLSNWAVVAKSVRQNLELLEEQLIAGERTTLGWTKDSSMLIEPMVRLAGLQEPYPDGISAGQSTISFGDLRRQIDERLAARGSTTRLYFIAGEAGIGKTRTLVAAALSRAREVEAESDDTPPHERLPLFFYVRSTGQASNSLQTVINAEAAATRNLNVENIRALCRNGLMALLVDGFDELLGGVGYDNALGSLREWIEAMSGRGVLVVSARSSYYLNQYRSSIANNKQNRNLAIDHRVASVQRWTDSQVEKFLRHHGVDPAGRDRLGLDDRELLGLPFFARVYVEAVAMTNVATVSLPDVILEQYLKREATKLIMPGDQGRPLMEPNELQATFETLAQLMAEQSAREVDLDELTLAVQLVLGDDALTSRRGLANRLSVLCGLAVSGASTADRRFTFQHELFYDIFLANAIVRELKQDQYERVVDMLGRTQWRVATVSRLVRLVPERTHLLLTGSLHRVDDLPVERQKPFRANVGSIWESLIRRTREVDVEEVTDAAFESLDLTGVRVGKLDFRSCSFDSLTFPPTGNWNVGFTGCVVDALWVKKSGRSLSGIKTFDDTSVRLLVQQDSLRERPLEIQRGLHDMGAPVPPVEDDDRNELEDAATFFLQNIANRTESIYVSKRNLEPAEVNTRWQFDRGVRLWVEFIRTLRDSEAASLVQVSAAGPPVLHVRIQSVGRLLDRNTDDESVAAFWRLVAERG
ncbi:NACHT domain-containing protein [Actinosynnema sp. NPDC091369]